jgi:hypothetical protein
LDFHGRNHAGAARIDLEGTLFRAALLSGFGSQASELAATMASVCHAGGGRSCVEAGAGLQIILEAPGNPELRVGLRLGDRLDKTSLSRLMPAERAAAMERSYGGMASKEDFSLGYWLIWSRHSQSIFADLRDTNPAQAVERLRAILDHRERQRLETILSCPGGGRPWGLLVEPGDDGVRRLQLYWYIGLAEAAKRMVEEFSRAGWGQVVEVLSHLLILPGQSGRWLLGIPLNPADEESCLWVGNSAWGFVPEDDRKHRAIGHLLGKLGGKRDYAEAMWSFCQGAAEPGWRLGRTCEVGLGKGGLRARLLLTPQVHAGATAGISNSDSFDSNTGPVDEDPFAA